MLKPAKNYEIELNHLTAESIFVDNAKWWYRNYEDTVVEIAANFYNNIQLVSVNMHNEVIGYFYASIDRQLHSVDSISCIHFTNDQHMLFAKDIKAFLEYLIYKQNFKKINWGVVIGNPIEKAYDRLCKKHHGRVVGIKKYDTIIHGVIYDLKMYEWINDYYECFHCGHREKREAEVMCRNCGIGEMIYHNPFRN